MFLATKQFYHRQSWQIREEPPIIGYLAGYIIGMIVLGNILSHQILIIMFEMDTKKRENLVVYFKLLLLMHYDTVRLVHKQTQ